jgi:hypothetical protein
MDRKSAAVATDPSRVLGVKEVSGVLGCAERTVTKMIDTGVLKGWRLPSADGKSSEWGRPAQPRRVLLRDLLDFLCEQGLPPEMMAGLATRFVLCGCCPRLSVRLSEECPGLVVTDESTLLSAGLVIGRYGAEAFVVGPGLPRSYVMAVPAALSSARGRPTLVALTPEDQPESAPYREAGYNEVLPGHATAALVLETVRRLRSARAAARNRRLRGISP